MRFQNKQKRTIPFKKAMIRILVYTLFISGSAAFAVLYYFHIKEIQLHDERFTISALSQAGPLSSEYFAELFNLSVDRPTNLYHFNVEDAKKKLLASPIIKSAEIDKIKPATLSIEYTLRRPIAYLNDFSNTAIDVEGFLVPVEPFFSKVEMPEITIGDLGSQIKWGEQLRFTRFTKAMDLISLFSEEEEENRIFLKKIDVSKAESPSCGVREIVVVLEEHSFREYEGRTYEYIFPRILRLNPDNIHEQLSNYKILREHLLNQEISKLFEPTESSITAQTTIIDLRIPQLAFLSSDSKK